MEKIGEKELQENPASSGGIALRSPKELYFYKLFQRYSPRGMKGSWHAGILLR
jgi:hypothetical protein